RVSMNNACVRLIYFATSSPAGYARSYGIASSPLFHWRGRGGKRFSGRAEAARFAAGVEPAGSRSGRRTQLPAFGTERQVRAAHGSRPNLFGRSAGGATTSRGSSKSGAGHCHGRERQTARRLCADTDHADFANHVTRLSNPTTQRAHT